MKTKVHLRVGYDARRRKTKVEATVRPNHSPLSVGEGVIPTVAFALVLDIPDVLFDRASQVIAEIEIPEDQAIIAAQVTPR